MYNIYLELPGHPQFSQPFICIHSNRPVFASSRARQLARAYLPGIRFHKAARQHELLIFYFDSEEEKLVAEDKHIALYDRWSGDGTLLDLLHLIYSAARSLWLWQWLYPVHSACVGNDSYILLVGHSGSGKTAVSLALAEKHGMKVFSTNKTLLQLDESGSISAVAGTKTVTASKADAGKHQPKKASSYLSRSAFRLDACHRAPPGPARIRAITLIRLNDGYDRRQQLTAGSALHALYPYLLDQVNADTVLCGGKEVFVSNTPLGSQQRLATELARCLTEVPVYSLSGSMNFVTDQLKGL